jgi:hypothetical protein
VQRDPGERSTARGLSRLGPVRARQVRARAIPE